MKSPARDIDHLTLMLSDVATAAKKLEKLGFNLTSDKTDPRLICFQPAEDDIPNYLELTESDMQGVVTVVNVADLQGEERAVHWDNEEGDKVKASIIVGAGGG